MAFQRRDTRPNVRRLVPARDLGLPLYVQSQGATVGKRGETITIRQEGRLVEEVRLLDISQVCLFGNVQITAQALRDVATREIPVCHFTFGGWFTAITHGLGHKNIELRLRQFETAAEADRSLALARAFISGKVRNSYTLLRRNHPDLPTEVTNELRRLRDRIATANSPETLLGLEGATARTYFGSFAGLLKTDKRIGFHFEHRNRRPPRDTVNALLSFVYSLLIKDLVITLQAVGFDPHLGFYHRPRYGRPALALDLAEEFRPLIGDSVVLTLINNGEVQERDFLHRAGAVALTPTGRKQVIAAYERRMDSLITHPLFGYAISYRRVLAVQARLLARHLLGELPTYVPFVTR